MATQDLPTPPAAAGTAEAPDTAVNRRTLLIIGGMAIVAIIVVLLSLRSSSASMVVPSGSLLLLAPAAFLAGVFSFLSPCTLPILPAYFAFTFQARRERVILMTVAFFMGLATTMVLLGAAASAISQYPLQRQRELTLGGGLLVIGFGIMSLLGRGFSGAQILDRPAASVAGSYVYGATFALGWTACVGPILGALFTLLTTQGIAVIQGAVLAFIYALGLGTPLIIVAAFFSRLGKGSRFWTIMRGRSFSLNLGVTTLHLHSTSILSGVLLIGVGTLLATGQLSRLSEWSLQTPLAQWALTIEQFISNIFVGN